MSDDLKLSDQQYQIAEALWALGKGTAKEVQGWIDSPLAHTTVATILTRMEKKGLLSSTVTGRERIYTPLVSKAEANRSMVSSLVSTVFRGKPDALLAHLVREGDIDADALKQIRALLKKEGAQK